MDNDINRLLGSIETNVTNLLNTTSSLVKAFNKFQLDQAGEHTNINNSLTDLGNKVKDFNDSVDDLTELVTEIGTKCSSFDIEINNIKTYITEEKEKKKERTTFIKKYKVHALLVATSVAIAKFGDTVWNKSILFLKMLVP